MNTETQVSASRNRVGDDLTRLRLNAKAKQSKIAEALKIDTSRISRIETGPINPEADEVVRIAKAIGTAEAKDYAIYFKEHWTTLAKPSFWHPSRQQLRQAEEQIVRLDEFTNGQQTTEVARAQAKLYRDTLVEAADYLRDLNHSVAFVGEIGVGKSTAICGMTGLLLPVDPKAPAALSKRVVLEAGAGRMTLCEVQLRAESKHTFGLVVHPHSQEEVFRTVNDFCEGIVDAYKGSQQEADANTEGRGVSEEVGKALRNMAGLTRKLEKGPDGKPVRRDPAMELARVCGGNPAELTAEVLKRLKLEQRTKTEVRFEEQNLSAGLRRLKELFADINKGLSPDVSLPRRIDVIVPVQLLGKRPYSIGVIDTKGVDGTAVRPDIRAYLDDHRTVTVLCSRYPAAPDNSVQQILENLASTGAERTAAERVVLLVLARSQEVLDTQDDAGNRVETAEEGYRIKEDQVVWALTNIKGADKLPVVFFDVLSDDHHEIVESLAGQIQKLRDRSVQRINETSQAIEQLIRLHGEEQTKKAQAEVQRRLRIFVQQHLKVGPQTQPLHDAFIHCVRTTHARTVWATTRRNGSWPGLDAYHLLGVGAAIDAQKRTQGAFAGLEELIGNMLGDGTLAPASDYLSELRRAVPLWKEKFISESTASGREIYRATLFADDVVWDDCASLWGSGGGFRVGVASRLQEWCERHSELGIAVEKRVENAWKSCFLQPLAGLCESLDLFPNEDSPQPPTAA
jgi:transcriptional regulator with XRE-family HTH domain